MELEALLEIVERIGTDNPPTDDELNQARADLSTLLQAALGAPDNPSERPDLAAGTTIRAAIDDIASELAARQEQRDSDRAAALALMDGLEVTVPDPDAENGLSDEHDGENTAEDIELEAPEPVAVGASINDLRAAVRRTAGRVAADAEIDSDNPYIKAVGMGPAAGAVPNPNLTLDEAGALFHKFNRHVGRSGRVALLRLEKTYPESRQFGMSVEENTRMVEAVTGQRAITASGGICGPLDADFTHPVCSDRGRPIRDGLPAFQADRGGIRFAPAITVGDLTSAITVWTEANDASESPAIEAKACPHIDCEDELEAKVDAIVKCITVGNFQAKFNPEFWRSRLDLLQVEHDREAEQVLFAQIQAEATDVSWAATEGGTAKEALRALDRAVAGLRSRHRISRSTTMNWIAPDWLRDALRSSLTNQAPGDMFDPYSAADSTISNFFANRNIRPIWSPDLQVFSAQAAGALAGFPTTATTVVYPEGTFVFLDGGSLDLGIEITDSTLNATNDRQAFAETFEGLVKRGCEALELVVPVGDDCNCVGAI
jgi:hypothetical protein